MTTFTPIYCPFCGGESSLVVPYNFPVADCVDVYVRCNDCGVEGPHIIIEARHNDDNTLDDNYATAIAAWNTRTTPPARSYADGVEHVEQAIVLLTPPDNVWTGREPSWQSGAYGLLNAAIRLLSQGGQA